ncbi:50S ribosomal protein L15 [Candidatus Gracilibacteria bacterium]|nr:50S ribosomal protein L15 [Candidatus Gracilibacteria bacterium]
MKLHELAPKIAKKARVRRGQGNSAGKGNFSGRGCKGQKARAGGGVRQGFEGGQTPLIQRMPKRPGFKNPNRIETQVINVAVLEEHFKAGEKVHFESLLAKKLIGQTNSKVKLLGDGELTKKLDISGLLVSKSAKEKVEKAGGSVA